MITKTTRNLYLVTAGLFWLAAAVAALGRSHDYGSAAIWLALGAVFMALTGQKSN